MTSFEVRPGMLTAFSIGSVKTDKDKPIWNGHVNHMSKRDFYKAAPHRRALIDSFGGYIHHIHNMREVPPFYTLSPVRNTFEQLSPGLYGLNSVRKIADRDKAHMTDLELMEDILDTEKLNRWLDINQELVLDRMIEILAHTHHDRAIVKAAFMNYALSNTLRGTEDEEATKYLLSPPNFHYGNGSIDFYTDPGNGVVPASSQSNLGTFPSGLLARKHHIDSFVYTPVLHSGIGYICMAPKDESVTIYGKDNQAVILPASTPLSKEEHGKNTTDIAFGFTPVYDGTSTHLSATITGGYTDGLGPSGIS